MNITADAVRPFGDVLYSADLPPPISVNNLFHNVPKAPDGTRQKGRAKSTSYKNWITAAGNHLIAQGRRPQLTGPVGLVFTLAEDASSAQRDTDNCAKAYVDLLVKHRIIPDDNRRIVRHLSLTWVPGARFAVQVYRWRAA